MLVMRFRHRPPVFPRYNKQRTQKVKKDKPFSYWLPVQRWVTIEEAGTYDLFCFYTSNDYEVIGRNEAILSQLSDEIRKGHDLDENYNYLIDKSTGQMSEKYEIRENWIRPKPNRSPLLEMIPEDVLNHIAPSDSASTSLDYLNYTDYAHFQIHVLKPTQNEAEQMIQQWSEIANDTDHVEPHDRAQAAYDAIWFIRQNNFLPFIKKAIQDQRDINPSLLDGLAMNPDKQTLELLMKADMRNGLYAMTFLSDERKKEMIPT